MTQNNKFGVQIHVPHPTPPPPLELDPPLYPEVINSNISKYTEVYI